MLTIVSGGFTFVVEVVELDFEVVVVVPDLLEDPDPPEKPPPPPPPAGSSAKMQAVGPLTLNVADDDERSTVPSRWFALATA